MTMYIEGVQIRYVKVNQGDEKHSRYTNKVRTIFSGLVRSMMIHPHKMQNIEITIINQN